MSDYYPAPDELRDAWINVAPSSAIPLNGQARVSQRSAQNIPQDAEESLSDWHRERDRIQNERDLEEAAWHEQELLQEETDNT